jgi:hypothetical protein
VTDVDEDWDGIPVMRADRGFLLTVLTVVAVWALGYVAYAVSASVHPGPAPPSTAQPQEQRDS